jgi:hypothetical protein
MTKNYTYSLQKLIHIIWLAFQHEYYPKNFERHTKVQKDTFPINA